MNYSTRTEETLSELLIISYTFSSRLSLCPTYLSNSAFRSFLHLKTTLDESVGVHRRRAVFSSWTVMPTNMKPAMVTQAAQASRHLLCETRGQCDNIMKLSEW